MSRNTKFGFTLIELLIVVAIIAILAAIAIPNLLEAQTRSKAAKAKSELRTIATALEAYATDHEKYPPTTLLPLYARFIRLTTPVSYMTSIPDDDFNMTEDPHHGQYRAIHNYFLATMPFENEKLYVLTSDGPDRLPDHTNAESYEGYSPDIWENPSTGYFFIRYDPTNGTISTGDIWRLSDHQL